MKPVDVAVVGAGWAGLTAASRLTTRGYSVVVVEKSRGAGGRSSTRRDSGYFFDHGAQYFTARSDAFSRQVDAWRRAGLVAVWQPVMEVFGARPQGAGETPAKRLVGTPSMNAVLQRFARGIDVRFGWRVNHCQFEKHWTLESIHGASLRARSLVVTAPAPQAQALLDNGPGAPQALGQVELEPCWALMLGFAKPVEAGFDAAFVNEGPLRWMARNSAKPGRAGGESWVVHASGSWSREHLEADGKDVARQMLAACRCLSKSFRAEPALVLAHRWRYARTQQPLKRALIADDRMRLVLAGDWCAGDRIEGAWTSGVAAARRIDAVLS